MALVYDGAGRVIGGLERFLVYLAIIVHAPLLIAVVIGAKTIVRFPELAQRGEIASPGSDRPSNFAEYYLVGTLLSLSVGVLGPLLVQFVLYLLEIQPF
jgi:hypothetical protein